jgi:hypothetical protein
VVGAWTAGGCAGAGRLVKRLRRITAGSGTGREDGRPAEVLSDHVRANKQVSPRLLKTSNLTD